MLSVIRRASILRWAARILSLIVIGFLLLFLFGEGLSPITVLHIFFPFGVMLGLVLSWFFEGAGATVTILSIAVFYLIHYLQNGILPVGPFFLVSGTPSVFFLASMFMQKRLTKEHSSQQLQSVDLQDVE